MQIALDPYMLRDRPFAEVCRIAAEIGYDSIELSPRADFIPFFTHPRADRSTVAEFRKALGDTGIELASILPLYRWSGPDEDERQAAVRYWKRAIQLAVDVGCATMNSEFNGRPEQSARNTFGSSLWIGRRICRPSADATSPTSSQQSACCSAVTGVTLSCEVWASQRQLTRVDAACAP